MHVALEESPGQDPMLIVVDVSVVHHDKAVMALGQNS